MSNVETTAEKQSEVLEEELPNSQQNYQQNNFNQQNNFHFSQVDIKSVEKLYATSPELADRAMTLFERQQEHQVTMDKKIIELEEKNLNSIIEQKPYARKYTFRGQLLAFITTFGAMVGAYFTADKSVFVAGLFLTVGAGVVAVQFFGGKPIQTKSTQEKEPIANE